jgi:hypothetical protein
MLEINPPSLRAAMRGPDGGNASDAMGSKFPRNQPLVGALGPFFVLARLKTPMCLASYPTTGGTAGNRATLVGIQKGVILFIDFDLIGFVSSIVVSGLLIRLP